MEKADNIYIIPGNFGWDDIGSWLAVGRIKKTDDDNNVVIGNIFDNPELLSKVILNPYQMKD